MGGVANHSLIDALLALETPKTWSLIATVFGDLDGEQLSGKALWALLEPLGVKKEAMRVALHRLKKEGWLESEKRGREGVYRLSDPARRETIAARQDVYRQDLKYPEGWRICIAGPDSAAPEGVNIVLDRSLFLVPATAAVAPGVISLALPRMRTRDLPEWFEDCLVPGHIRAQAVPLTALATAFLDERPRGVEAVSARLLFVHYWRKMALRTGVWAHSSLFPSGVMARCQAVIGQVLASSERTRAA